MLTLLLFAGGCVKRRSALPPPVVRGPAYVELQPEWRVQVITPLLKSGGFLLKTTEQQESGNTITLRAGDEFLGYETAIYSVSKHPKEGVRVVLTEVAMNRDGQLTHPAKSFAPRLRMPKRMRHVRLLYSLKVSDADHGMAVLAARNLAALGELTTNVQARPETECRNSRESYCEWVPAGIAMRVEKRIGADWKPAN